MISIKHSEPDRSSVNSAFRPLFLRRPLASTVIMARRSLPLWSALVAVFVLLVAGEALSARGSKSPSQSKTEPTPGLEESETPTPQLTPAPQPAKSAPQVHDDTPVPVEPTLSPAGQRIWWAGTSGPFDRRARVRHLNSLNPGPTKQSSMPGAVRSYTANFQDDLFMQTDLVLPGIESVQTVTFTRPRSWRILPGSELLIQIEHSSALIAEQSHLTISLNDVALRSVRLDSSNIIGGEIHIPIPESMLQDYNRLKFEVQQHYTFECEDPFDRSLWTKVSRFSEIHFKYQEKVIEPDLGKFPLPLVDRTGYGHTVLRYLLPTRPSSQTIEALGLVTAGLGRDVAYSRLAMEQPVRSLAETSGHTILVGTAQENPEIGRLAGERLAGLGADQGLLALVPHPSNPLILLLVVSGGGPEGVLKAARTISTPHRRFVLSGSYAIISQLEPEDPATEYERQGFVPNSGNFNLKDLGYHDTTARGYFASPIQIEVRTFPDQKFLERLQSFRLIYSYGAQLDNRLSTLEVRWNNITVQSVGLTRPEGETRAEVNIDLPVEIMTAFNTLQIIFHLLPRSYNPCETKHDHPLWGTIFSDSSFDFHRYRYIELPDLSKLQFGLFPYGVHQDLRDTLLVLPDSPEPNDLAAGLSVAAELGRSTVAKGVALKLMQSADVSPQLRSENHMILINTGRPSSLLDSLSGQRVVTALSDSKTITGSKGVLLHSKDINTLAFVEQILSPFASGKVITILQGLTPETLQRALAMLLDIRLMSQLNGDVSVMDREGDIEGIAIRPQESFGTIPALVQARAFGRKHPWAIVSGLLAALAILYLLLKALLELYRRRHHGHVLTEPTPEELEEEAAEQEAGAPPASPLVNSDGPEAVRADQKGQIPLRAELPEQAPSGRGGSEGARPGAGASRPVSPPPSPSYPAANPVEHATEETHREQPRPPVSVQGMPVRHLPQNGPFHGTTPPGAPSPYQPDPAEQQRPARRLHGTQTAVPPEPSAPDDGLTRRRPRPGRPPQSGDT